MGETLTATTSGIADADGIANAIFTYQWLADDAAIGGATVSTYTVVAGGRGQGPQGEGDLHRRSGQR